MYDPVIGRWISEDPLGFMAGDTNLARYVGNGATNATDASGLQTQYPKWTVKTNSGPNGLGDGKVGYIFGTRLVSGDKVRGRSFIEKAQLQKHNVMGMQRNVKEYWYIYYDTNTGRSRKSSVVRSTSIDAWFPKQFKTPASQPDKLKMVPLSFKADEGVCLVFVAEKVSKTLKWHDSTLLRELQDSDQTGAEQRVRLQRRAEGLMKSGREFKESHPEEKNRKQREDLEAIFPKLNEIFDKKPFAEKLWENNHVLKYDTRYFFLEQTHLDNISAEHRMEIAAFIKETGFDIENLKWYKNKNSETLLFEGYKHSILGTFPKKTNRR